MSEKQILLNQIITDLESAKKVVDEQGFIAQDEFDRIIKKVEQVKELEDMEIIEREAKDNDPPEHERNTWPEMHGAHDTESGPEV